MPNVTAPRAMINEKTNLSKLKPRAADFMSSESIGRLAVLGHALGDCNIQSGTNYLVYFESN
jgi:hypothetical protein